MRWREPSVLRSMPGTHFRVWCSWELILVTSVTGEGLNSINPVESAKTDSTSQSPKSTVGVNNEMHIKAKFRNLPPKETEREFEFRGRVNPCPEIETS